MTNKISVFFMGPLLIFLVVVFCVILPKEVLGQNLRGIDVVPDKEKRSCLQTVDGYAYLSENMTLSETRVAAFANAKRQAMEAGRTYDQGQGFSGGV